MSKVKQLTGSCIFGLILLFLGLFFARGAIHSFVAGETTVGTFGAVSTRIVRRSAGTTQKQSHLNTGHVSYEVNGKPYQLSLNIHVWKELGFIKNGSKVTVAYLPESPEVGYPLDYLLFSIPAFFFFSFASIILLLVPPQLLYALHKAGKEREATEALKTSSEG